MTLIRPIEDRDLQYLNRLPPDDWNFDYESFLKNFMQREFFHSFVLEVSEEIIGTGNVLIKDSIGWLAHILVDSNYRNNGYGSQITKFLVDFLHDKGCTTQLLIATELGLPVYEKLGFRKICVYPSYETVEPYKIETNPHVRNLTENDKSVVYAMDLEINGEDRKHLIDIFFENSIGYFSDNNELLGFYLPSFGRGLVLSKSNLAGVKLLEIKHAIKGKRTLLPDFNVEAINTLKELGLQQGYSCYKMYLGTPNDWLPEFIFSYGSGYCG